jgi:hypothetical protein
MMKFARLPAYLALMAFLPVVQAADRLVYKTPRGAEFTVTADGLSSIKVGGRELAKGGWSAWIAEGWFKDCGSRKVKAEKLGEKKIEVLGADRAAARYADHVGACERILQRRCQIVERIADDAQAPRFPACAAHRGREAPGVEVADLRGTGAGIGGDDLIPGRDDGGHRALSHRD